VAARAVCALVLLAGWATADELSDLVDQLGTKQSYTAYRQLTKRKQSRAIPMIEKRIAGWTTYGQHFGILYIASFPPKKSRPPLRRLTRSEDPHLRITAAAELHRLGEKKMVPIIVGALLDKKADPTTLNAMVGRIRYLGVPAIHEAWRALLTPDRSSYHLLSWLAALSKEGYGGAQAEAKVIAASHKQPGARTAAAAYLVRFGEEQGTPLLAAAIRSGEIGRSDWPKLEDILTGCGRYPEAVLAAIVERLPKQQDERALGDMIRILVAARYEGARDALTALIGHPTVSVSKHAMSALAALGAQPKASELHKMLASKKPSRQLTAARMLRRMDDDAGLPITLRLARESGDPTIRAEAIAIAGEFRRAECVDLLIDALDDNFYLTRMAALNGLEDTLRTIFPFRNLDLRRTGYNYARKTSAERAPSIATIRAWWKKNRDADW
jgi:HEAT repeat protein